MAALQITAELCLANWVWSDNSIYRKQPKGQTDSDNLVNFIMTKRSGGGFSVVQLSWYCFVGVCNMRRCRVWNFCNTFATQCFESVHAKEWRNSAGGGSKGGESNLKRKVFTDPTEFAMQHWCWFVYPYFIVVIGLQHSQIFTTWLLYQLVTGVHRKLPVTDKMG